MRYITRHIEKTLAAYAEMFGVVLITGARQVGKSTLLQNCYPKTNYITFDDDLQLERASDDPELFLMDNKPPLILDEVQYIPSIFKKIKIDVDKTNESGRFFMTGSQQFSMMKNVTESLAGRAGILSLLPLSFREVNGDTETEQFIPTEEYIQRRTASALKYDTGYLWEFILNGGMPAFYSGRKCSFEAFYSSYLRTYIDRDISSLAQVGDKGRFVAFLRALSAHTGQLLNKTALANEVGITAPTAEKWLTVLESSGIIYRLRPYSSNVLKREIKTPKLYFINPGLAAYLAGWRTAEILKNGAMSGAYFENYVFCEILKSCYNNGILDPAIYFFRDRDGHEIDFVIEQNDTLYPIEVKKHANPSNRDCREFAILEKIPGKTRGTGCVINFNDNLMHLTQKDYALPVRYL